MTWASIEGIDPVEGRHFDRVIEQYGSHAGKLNHLAMEIALTGEHLPAARLAEAGLVNRLVPAGTALDAARELAGRLALGAPLALAASKRVIVESADWPASGAFARQAEIITPVFMSRDAAEGALAFAAERSPVWRGE